MGRELRKVPANWNHPKTMRRWGEVGYQPMYDRRFEDAFGDYEAERLAWERGERPSYYDPPAPGEPEPTFAEYSGDPPDPAYYRPYSDSEATWFQVYETVSEGTPVTPPFATKEELVEYLCTYGDFWDQSRRRKQAETGILCPMDCQPWSRKSAESFVFGIGQAPSLVVDSDHGVRTGVQALGE